jgi:hypothetical protein
MLLRGQSGTEDCEGVFARRWTGRGCVDREDLQRLCLMGFMGVGARPQICLPKINDVDDNHHREGSSGPKYPGYKTRTEIHSKTRDYYSKCFRNCCFNRVLSVANCMDPPPIQGQELQHTTLFLCFEGSR